jgi:hypothetical protein
VAGAQTADEQERAREAYDRGTASYKHGDYLTAAKQYVLADQLAPNPLSLQAALDAAVHADDPVLGQTLLGRLAMRPTSDPTLASLGAIARARFAHRTARIRFACPEGCTGSVDGEEVDTTTDVFVLPGAHQVSFQVEGHVERRSLEMKLDESVSVGREIGPASPSAASTTSKAPAAPAPEEDGSSLARLDPAWFLLSLVATGVLGPGAALSAADTVNKHNEFQAAGCTTTGSAACDTLGNDGPLAQLRTNVLLGATAATAATTALLGLVFVRWRTPSAKGSASVSPGVGPFSSISVSF